MSAKHADMSSLFTFLFVLANLLFLIHNGRDFCQDATRDM